MKKKIYILIFTFLISDVKAVESLKYYLNKAIKQLQKRHEGITNSWNA